MLAIALAIPGCQTVVPIEAGIHLTQVVRETPGGASRWQEVEPPEVGLRVWRQDREIRAARGMRLERGDVVETGPRSAAVIRFRGAAAGEATGTTTLDANTRVRLGSLEVFFGRVFANIRGFFETSSETVIAGVEGTRFLFEVGRDRRVEVSVVEGVVTCRSPLGAWAPVRLHANETLVQDADRAPPRVVPTDPGRMRDAQAWSEEIERAETRGWCCVGGQVVPSTYDRCASGFAASRDVAEAYCRPLFFPPRQRFPGRDMPPAPPRDPSPPNRPR